MHSHNHCSENKIQANDVLAKIYYRCSVPLWSKRQLHPPRHTAPKTGAGARMHTPMHHP